MVDVRCKHEHVVPSSLHHNILLDVRLMWVCSIQFMSANSCQVSHFTLTPDFSKQG